MGICSKISQNLSLKIAQNRVTNSWYIAASESCWAVCKHIFVFSLSLSQAEQHSLSEYGSINERWNGIFLRVFTPHALSKIEDYNFQNKFPSICFTCVDICLGNWNFGNKPFYISYWPFHEKSWRFFTIYNSKYSFNYLNLVAASFLFTPAINPTI